MASRKTTLFIAEESDNILNINPDRNEQAGRINFLIQSAYLMKVSPSLAVKEWAVCFESAQGLMAGYEHGAKQVINSFIFGIYSVDKNLGDKLLHASDAEKFFVFEVSRKFWVDKNVSDYPSYQSYQEWLNENGAIVVE